MKNICSKGFKASNADIKAFEEYLLETPKKWAEKALKGMINKAVTIILKDWLDIYKEKASDSISAQVEQLIPEIINMEEFKPYGLEAPEKRKAKRKEKQTIEIWEGGFDIEDYEFEALNAYYKDPEEYLKDLMENKIALRKSAFAKKYTDKLINDPSTKTIPIHDDNLINFITSLSGYKNRKEIE